MLNLFLFVLSFSANADMGQFKISGMHCGGCVKAIKSKVCALEGIESCVVKVGSMSLTTKEGHKLDFDKIEAAVARAGEYRITQSQISADGEQHQIDAQSLKK